ncbi:MAG TPA: ATP synthase F1 subunit gamma [Candidatus Nealsonbacteria bacterium]|uniref:ATP synthase gamma chain n=1 Tax=marine sediment metagenome TaxID=412755 RepID=A0A0F9VFN3_9ZZZZ|nr:ATP synthase F1 subunit gamma [Candidatus Nealsonbacteria bacterium]HEB46547.1 ATP synthase F1 subunit gamma [Candidatus Nealsonbacteria bacterium]
MLSPRDIKRKIKSVGNTKQITKAMEMVSAAKMRRSQQVALQSRPYCESALELLGNLSWRAGYKYHPLLVTRPIKKKVLIVITSDKGLCGGLNSNVLKKSLRYLEENSDKSDKRVDIITIGRKARDYLAWRGYNIRAEFTKIGDLVKVEDTAHIAALIMDLYKEEEYDLIAAIYTNFISTLKQEVVLRQVLPISIEGIKEIVSGIVPKQGRYAELEDNKKTIKETSFWNYEYKLEPSAKEVLNELLPGLLKIQIYHMILEANASEHSARMVAMKNASENAEKLINELAIIYNKLRQSAITKEISEITAGREALNV